MTARTFPTSSPYSGDPQNGYYAMPAHEGATGLEYLYITAVAGTTPNSYDLADDDTATVSTGGIIYHYYFDAASTAAHDGTNFTAIRPIDYVDGGVWLLSGIKATSAVMGNVALAATEAQALAADAAGKTIMLIADITLTANWTPAAAIDTNGQTITLGAFDLAFTTCQPKQLTPSCFNENSTGAVSGLEKSDPKYWGATTGTTTDQAAHITNAFSAAKHVIISQQLCIDSGVTFSQADGTLEFINGGELYAKASITGGAAGVNLLTLSGNDQRIHNLKVNGNKANNAAEKAMGVNITGSRIHLYSPEVHDIPTQVLSWGDGIYVQGNTTGVRIFFPHVHDNGRNGIAVVNGVDVEILMINSHDNGYSGIDAEIDGGELDDFRVIGGRSSGDKYGVLLIGESSAAAKSTGAADTNTAGKLVNSAATFSADGVVAGCLVYNSTDDVFARVTAVDSETSLSLDWDAFPDGNENYEVYDRILHNAKVTGMTIEDATNNAVVVRTAMDIDISGNTIRGPGLHGIFMETSTTYRYIIDAKVRANRVWDASHVSAHGIHFEGTNATAYYVRDSQFTGNIVGAVTNYGVYGRFSRNCRVFGNLGKSNGIDFRFSGNDNLTFRKNQGESATPIELATTNTIKGNQTTTRFGTIAAGTDDELPVMMAIATNGIYVQEVYVTNAADITQSDTDYETFNAQNKGTDGTGTTSFFSSAPTTKITGGKDINAFDPCALGVNQNQLVPTGNAISFLKTHAASGQGTDGMLVTVEYMEY